MKFNSTEKEQKFQEKDIWHLPAFDSYLLVFHVEWKEKIDGDFFGDYDVKETEAFLPGYIVVGKTFMSKQGAEELIEGEIESDGYWDLQGKLLTMEGIKKVGVLPENKVEEFEKEWK